jgi:putative CocE/NonD family hydrolase
MGPLKNANNNYLKNEIPFWNDLMNNGTYNDFWKSRNIRPHLKNINPAVMVVGGFFDAENCFGALETYKSIESQNPTINNTLVMGPWYHGGWVRSDGDKLGNIFFGSMTSEYYIQNVELPFFNYHLKGKGELNLPEALIFETGSNVWKSYEFWPPKNLIKKDLFINSDGTLTFNKKENQNDFTEYVSDPSNPVPYTQTKSVRMVKEYMVEDQRFVSDRSDVLIFESDVLESNVTLAGPINVELFVSTSGTDSDWIIKIIDVFPDDHPNYEFTPDSIKMGGFQMLVRGDIMRGKFRNSFENPEPFIPNEVTNISFALNDVSHTFKKGHKIMVQIQSSWFPLFDRNPQKFVDIYNADEIDFQKAVNRVYSSNEFQSKIEINIIE